MHSQLQIAKDVLFQTVADEAVLLNLADNHYYGLDDVAARMWALLMESGDAETVVQQMLAEYEVDERTLRQDLNALLAQLEKRKLIIRVPAQ